MKRMLLALGVFGVGLAVVCLAYLYFGATTTGRVNAPRILAAAQAYRRALEAEGTLIPPYANVQDLVGRGFLRARDIRAFSGMVVTVSLATNLNDPNDVLMRARLPDGTEMVALADGSVREAKP